MRVPFLFAFVLSLVSTTFTSCGHEAVETDIDLPDIKIIRISKSECQSYLDETHNPPNIDDTFSEKDYAIEWNEARQAVASQLEKKWMNSLDDGDLYVPMAWQYDRLLSVEIAKRRVLHPQLLINVHKAISSLQQDYSVDLCNALGYLVTDDGKPFPDFNVFVERRRILVYSESSILYPLLGIADKLTQKSN